MSEMVAPLKNWVGEMLASQEQLMVRAVFETLSGLIIVVSNPMWMSAVLIRRPSALRPVPAT